MAKKTQSTSKHVEKDDMVKAENNRRKLAAYFKDEEKMPVTISPLYRPYFGNVMTISINGITIAIKCDGRAYQVPKTYACEALGRIAKVDNIIDKRRRMRDVTNNVEVTPGDLQLF